MTELKKLLTEFIEKMIGEKVYRITFRAGLNNYLICNLKLSEERMIAFTSSGYQFYDGCNHHNVENREVRRAAADIYFYLSISCSQKNGEHKFEEWLYY